VHDAAGFNYRLPNLNAALGCAQLERLPKFVQLKRQLAELYEKAFRNIDQVRLIREPFGSKSNYWLQSIQLKGEGIGSRDQLLAALNDSGLMSRPVWRLMHRLGPYQESPRAPLPVAERLEQRLINIPSSPFLANSSKIFN
jgi:perosamine synthetase